MGGKITDRPSWIFQETSVTERMVPRPCRITAALLPHYCRITAALLPHHCRRHGMVS